MPNRNFPGVSMVVVAAFALMFATDCCDAIQPVQQRPTVEPKDHIVIQTRVLTIEGNDYPAFIKDLDTARFRFPVFTPAAEDESGLEPATGSMRAMETVQTVIQSPCIIAELSDADVSRITRSVKGTDKISFVQSPTIKTLSGVDATLFNGANRPFVVGFTGDANAAPKVKMVPVGTRFRVKPTIVEDQIAIRGILEESDILEDSAPSLPPIPGIPEALKVLRFPKIKTNRIDFVSRHRNGQTILLIPTTTRKALRRRETPLGKMTIETVSVRSMYLITASKAERTAHRSTLTR